MDKSRSWPIRILAWRARQPAEVSWFAASGLFLTGLVVRLLSGHMYGANPSVAFYPAILIAAAILGWKEAAAILVLSVAVGAYLFVPHDMYLMPVVWLIVGGLNIALLAGLQHVARELLAADAHARGSPGDSLAGAAALVSPVLTSSEEGRRHAALSTLLEDAPESGLTTLVDLGAADLTIGVQPSDTRPGRFQAVTVLAVTAGDRVQERVFRTPEGARLTVSLRAIDSGRPVLTVVNYGAEPVPVVAGPEPACMAAAARD
jgi:hypothetical protein